MRFCPSCVVRAELTMLRSSERYVRAYRCFCFLEDRNQVGPSSLGFFPPHVSSAIKTSKLGSGCMCEFEACYMIIMWVCSAQEILSILLLISVQC